MKEVSLRGMKGRLKNNINLEELFLNVVRGSRARPHGLVLGSITYKMQVLG